MQRARKLWYYNPSLALRSRSPRGRLADAPLMPPLAGPARRSQVENFPKTEQGRIRTQQPARDTCRDGMEGLSCALASAKQRARTLSG